MCGVVLARGNIFAVVILVILRSRNDDVVARINQSFLSETIETLEFAHVGEEITSESVGHQCGEKCDSHVNCENEACHLLFIQCHKCAEKYDNCCSKACSDINKLPYEEQKRLRKGKKNSNKIFKKGRSKALKFKKTS